MMLCKITMIQWIEVFIVIRSSLFIEPGVNRPLKFQSKYTQSEDTISYNCAN